MCFKSAERFDDIFQAYEERNYHIFYQMCAAASRLPHLHLGHQNMFHYLNQGNDPLIDGVDDLVCFDETINALTMLGFSSKQQDDMLRILAAIMHLGNVNIGNSDHHASNNENDTENSYIHVNIIFRLSIERLLILYARLFLTVVIPPVVGQASFNDVRAAGHRRKRDAKMAVP